ncbi:DNA topoisomerase I, mitochondrial [Cricetulus griseus]|uniref:DNA topoisomerase n=1 Tax=Cricetulus griseus TaxID=10029 RepID=G3I5I0_CRIGR|nr:DNA topoisomerase I, mitochondrial [Cricetulus griseus]
MRLLWLPGAFQHVPLRDTCRQASRGAKANKAGWEEKVENSVKWRQLEHKGPYFTPAYEPLPDGVHFFYDGKPVKLSVAAEEVATLYGKMLHLECATKEVFQRNFFRDWRKEMTAEERKLITHLDKCDFVEIHKHFMEKTEARRTLPREKKQVFQNLQHFMEDKDPGDNLFDALTLALRTGNEKEEGETADTVGCCSLPVEHVRLHGKADGQEHVVELDFLGKDSIRYNNRVTVEKLVFQNLQHFMEDKDPGDNLFDALTTASLNKHLQGLMEGLTARVFRTYNASVTLQEQLRVLTRAEDSLTSKVLAYNRANRAVAILCNHQRAIPKTFEKSMQKLQQKIETKKAQVTEAQVELEKSKADLRTRGGSKSKSFLRKQQRLLKLEEQLARLHKKATDKEENKQVALGTAKLNYLDPRISIAWCKRFGVPIEKIYHKTQRERFAWAFNRADKDFEF